MHKVSSTPQDSLARQESSTVLKVVIIGQGNVGKTSLMQRYVSGHFDSRTIHTVGVDFMQRNVGVAGRSYTLQIWDTAGQERFRSLRTPFYRGADIGMLCFAVNDRDSFASLNDWRAEFLKYSSSSSASTGDVDSSSVPLFIVATKSDIIERTVSKSEAEAWASEKGPYPYIETSALAASNIDEAFRQAILSSSALTETGAISRISCGTDAVQLSLSTDSMGQVDGKSRKCC